MELHCELRRGVRRTVLGRIFFGPPPGPDVLVASIAVLSGGFKLVLGRKVARTFAAIVEKLAVDRPIMLVFNQELGKVKRVLQHLNLHAAREHRSLRVELSGTSIPLLAPILEAVTYPVFSAAVGEKAGMVSGNVLGSLETLYFAAVFEMYDDSMQILSKVLSSELVVNAVREAGVEEELQVFC